MSSVVSECGVQSFYAALRGLSSAARLVVAYSGGLDSHALLHLLAALREEHPIDLQAVHVNHGLQPQAEQWCRHCEATCATLEVPLRVVRVDARPLAGESPEDAARRARYDACAGLLQTGQELVTAHTCDDQAETLLLRLMRGTGPEGLGGIQPERAVGSARLRRPLLTFTRAELQEYLVQQGFTQADPAATGTLADTITNNTITNNTLPNKKTWI